MNVNSILKLRSHLEDRNNLEVKRFLAFESYLLKVNKHPIYLSLKNILQLVINRKKSLQISN